MTGSGLALGLGVAWLAVGAAVGLTLARQGQPRPTALSAVLAWPALVGLLGTTPDDGGMAAGPYAERIVAAFQALRAALTETGLTGTVDLQALAAMEVALRRADARLCAVDRLLADSQRA